MTSHTSLHAEPVAASTGCSCEAAASRAAYSYEFDGVEARIESLAPDQSGDSRCAGRAVVLPSLRRVECVLDSSTDFDAAGKYLAEYGAEGWEVWALVPLARLGSAHTAFSHVADRVQGWWQRADTIIAFTSPEVA